MSLLARRVAGLVGVPEDRIERLAGGDLSEVLAFRRADGVRLVAKGGVSISVEAAMLRALASAGVPVPAVEAEYDGILLLAWVANDRLFSPAAWRSIGEAVRRLHANHGAAYGWPADYRLGTVELDNRERSDWPLFWGEQRLAATARLLDRPWRERIDALVPRLAELLPAAPVPALLHGDLWSGNILVEDGRLAALVDPACCYGDPEVDLAMLHLFDTPPPEFAEAYGPLEPGWEGRRALYQLFPALVHLRLFGASYAPMVDRLLSRFEV